MTSLDATSGAAVRLDEAEAVTAAVSLDERRRELEALYRSHYGKLAGYFRRCGQNEALASELAQDTFILALRGLAAFKGQSKLSTWLWTIARNVLLGHLRGLPQAGQASAGDIDDVADPDSLTSAADGRLTDMCDCIRRGFASFTEAHPERAQVLYLAAVEGWTIRELAEFLNRTPHAATEYLSQCRAKLKPFIEDCNDDC